ncbi:MAG: diacylglycerol/lipid kinase family protein [Chloroflexia bacterium]
MGNSPYSGWMMVVCNPVSGSGRGVARLAVVRRTLEKAGISYASEITRGRGHATALAREAVLAGCDAVVGIGGDGTFHEVVNGVMGPAGTGAAVAGPRVAVGLVQAGRGSDFGRSAGVPSDLDAACARLVSGRTQVVDLGCVRYHSFRGEGRSRYFANAAGVGFDAEVTVRANSGSRALGGTITYLGSLLVTLGTYRNKRVAMRADGGEEWTGRINSMVVANGQYFGGGMKIAPEALLTDERFDVVILGDLGKIDLLRNTPRVYDGSHITHPKVRTLRACRVDVTSPDRLLLQADGEVLGTAPATFTVVPGALRLIV